MALTDLFYPKWKHSRAEVRLEAVRKMTMNADSDILRTIAQSDTDDTVRAAAVKRIDDEAFLADLLTSITDGELAEIICRRQDDLREAAIFTADNTTARMTILERVDSPDTLERIACSLDNVAVKLAATERINDPDRLHRITTDNCGLKVGLAIIERMDNPDVLERIAGDATNKKVARAATEKISRLSRVEERKASADAVSPATENATPDASMHLEALGQIIEEIESISTNTTPDIVRSALIDASVRWAAAATEAEAAGSPLANAAPDLIQRYESSVQRLESVLAAEERARQQQQALADLCRKAESLNAETPEDLSARRKKLEAEWDAAKAEVETESPSAELDEMQTEFTEALDRAEDRLRRSVAEARALESARNTAINRLTGLIREAESAADASADTPSDPVSSTDLRALKEKLEADWTTAVSHVKDAEKTPHAAPFEAAMQALGLRIEKREEAEAAVAQRQEEELRSFLSEMTALAESENRVGLDRKARDIRDEWKSAGALIPDIKEALTPEFEEICSRFFAAQRDFHEQKDWERWANATRKTELCELIERLTEDDLPAALGVVREAQKQWKETGPVDRDKSEDLWDRFRTACDRFFILGLEEKKGLLQEVEELVPANLADLIDVRPGAAPVSETSGAADTIPTEDSPEAADSTSETMHAPDLIPPPASSNASPSRSLATSVNWRATGDAIKKIQQKWRALGPLPAAVEGDIFERFQERCSLFFAARRRFYREQDRQRKENLGVKKALCDEAEALSGISDWRVGIEKVKALQARWKETGPVPRSENDRIWERFRTACDQFFDRMKADEPENLIRKTELCETAESLLSRVADDTEIGPVAERFKGLQQEWRDIGPVPKSEMKELNTRFRAACDAFFDKRNTLREQEEADYAINEERKTALVEAAEAVADSEDWKETADLLKRLQQEWKETGPVSRAVDSQLWKRFRTACDSFFQRRTAHFSEQDARREENGRRKEELCIAVESLAQLVLSPEEQKSLDGVDAAHTAEHLRMGLEFKETVVVPGNPGVTRSRAVSKIREYQREWKDLGPAPRAMEDALWRRFRQGTDLFFVSNKIDRESEKKEEAAEQSSS